MLTAVSTKCIVHTAMTKVNLFTKEIVCMNFKNIANKK